MMIGHKYEPEAQESQDESDHEEEETKCKRQDSIYYIDLSID